MCPRSQALCTLLSEKLHIPDTHSCHKYSLDNQSAALHKARFATDSANAGSVLFVTD